MLEKIKQLKGVNIITNSNLKLIHGGKNLIQSQTKQIPVCICGEGCCPDPVD